MHARPGITAEPIDFLIVAILDIEFEAVRRHIPGLEPQTHADDPIVYFCGSIPVGHDAAGSAYSVVLIQLLGMGNPGAAVGVTTALQRFAPLATIVVGIAGAAPGELAPGDVAISRDLVYYESGKQHEGRLEHRAPPVRAHPVLASRAKWFGETDWHVRITEMRPAGAGPAPVSRVKVGTIGSGEKVVNSASFIALLKREYKNLVAVAMEGSGAATPAAYFGTRVGDILEVRGISDLADGTKSDDWQLYAADAAAAFMVAFLATGPISSRQTSAAAQPFTAIRAQSMAPINSREVAAILRESGATKVTDVLVDLTPFARAGGAMRDPVAAVRALAAADGPFMRALGAGGVDHLAFYGHLHVPLAVLAGALATDRVPLRLLDFHRAKNPPGWAWPVSNDEAFPALQTTNADNPNGLETDAVLRVGISYTIKPELTERLLPSPRFTRELQVPEPVIDIVRSEAQARAYAREVRRSFDSLATANPRPARIHLFYAGPISVAFAIGQAFSPTIHPPVIAWNHRAGAYDWGLNLAETLDGEDGLVAPTLLRLEGG